VSDISEFKSRFQRLLELREARDIDKKKATTSEKAYREYEAELWEELSELGVKGTISFDFGGDLGTAKFVSRATTYGKIIDSEAALRALKAAGYGDVIYSEAVREGRLNELVRDLLESKTELPEGVDFYTRKGISISRKG
jgi:hypothetical protein